MEAQRARELHRRVLLRAVAADELTDVTDDLRSLPLLPLTCIKHGAAHLIPAAWAEQPEFVNTLGEDIADAVKGNTTRYLQARARTKAGITIAKLDYSTPEYHGFAPIDIVIARGDILKVPVLFAEVFAPRIATLKHLCLLYGREKELLEWVRQGLAAKQGHNQGLQNFAAEISTWGTYTTHLDALTLVRAGRKIPSDGMKHFQQWTSAAVSNSEYPLAMREINWPAFIAARRALAMESLDLALTQSTYPAFECPETTKALIDELDHSSSSPLQRYLSNVRNPIKIDPALFAPYYPQLKWLVEEINVSAPNASMDHVWAWAKEAAQIRVRTTIAQRAQKA